MSNLLDKWNKNRFSVYDSEEKTTLELIEKSNNFTKEIIKEVDNKVEQGGDFTGSWQGIAYPTLSEEGLRGTVEKHESDISNINKKLGRKIYNITDFGAIGDGLTDNTTAFINAFNTITDNSTLIIPNGEYIVHKDFNGTDTGNSKPLNQCIILKGLKDVTIQGEGNVIIRPNLQGVATTKKRFPCIISIDECENININNLTIEAKGENYGYSDSGSSVTIGNLRTNYVIQNGGSALLVVRSKKVIIDNVIGRLCGSCAVIYHSNISDCEVRNTMANPLSLGYAGFTTDTFCTNDTQFNNKIKYYNCVSKSEKVIRENNIIGQTLYNSKCGILLEGDTNPIICEIFNCDIRDSYANSLDTYLGCGIISTNAITVVDSCYFENCSNMVYKRDLLTSNGSLIVKNCTGVKLRTHGIVIKDLYSLSNLKDIIIDSNIINVEGGTTYTTDINYYLREMGGIVSAEFRNTSNIICTNNTIKCKENGFFQVANSFFTINNNTIICEKNNINLFGGGSVDIFNNNIKRVNYTTDSSNITLSTLAKDSTLMNFTISINKNVIEATNKTHQAIAILSSNPSTLVTLKPSFNNTFVNCCINADKTNARLPLENKVVTCISQSTLVGEYTVLKFDFSNNIGTVDDFKIISDTNTIYNLVKQGREIVDGKYLEIFYVQGDVRSQFTINKKYTLI